MIIDGEKCMIHTKRIHMVRRLYTLYFLCLFINYILPVLVITVLYLLIAHYLENNCMRKCLGTQQRKMDPMRISNIYAKSKKLQYRIPLLNSIKRGLYCVPIIEGDGTSGRNTSAIDSAKDLIINDIANALLLLSSSQLNKTGMQEAKSWK